MKNKESKGKEKPKEMGKSKQPEAYRPPATPEIVSHENVDPEPNLPTLAIVLLLLFPCFAQAEDYSFGSGNGDRPFAIENDEAVYWSDWSGAHGLVVKQEDTTDRAAVEDAWPVNRDINVWMRGNGSPNQHPSTVENPITRTPEFKQSYPGWGKIED